MAEKMKAPERENLKANEILRMRARRNHHTAFAHTSVASRRPPKLDLNERVTACFCPPDEGAPSRRSAMDRTRISTSVTEYRSSKRFHAGFFYAYALGRPTCLRALGGVTAAAGENRMDASQMGLAALWTDCAPERVKNVIESIGIRVLGGNNDPRSSR
jgi:hypothetical protein